MLTLEKMFDLRNKLQAFQMRDIQMVQVLLTWTRACGFTDSEVLEFSKIFPLYNRMEQIGYFNARTTPAQGKVIKEFERSLPVDVRRQFRRIRLEKSATGVINTKG